MKQILRYSLLVALALMVNLTANAGKIVFGELGLENGKQYSDPFDGGDFTVVFAGGANDGKYYNTGSGIRVYGGGTMTITAKSGSLTKIQVTYDGTNKPESADVVSTGSYDVSTGIWSGSASEVVFTRPSGSGHWRIKAIATNGDVEDVNVPTEGQTPETAITVTRALELVNALADGASTDATYYVKGVCTSIKSITSSNAQFYIGENANATDVVQTYGLKGLGNKTITNLEFVKAGDNVVVYGTLQKYKNNTSGEITPEVTSGYVYSVNGKTEDDAPNPEDAITTGTDASNPMTVDQALSYINGFGNGFITTKQYYVQGTVSEITEISTDNGNATFKMGNLVAFRLKGLENKNITNAEYLQANDEVVVLAKLQKYVKNDEVTPELSSGYIYMLNGKTTEGGDDPDPGTVVGDGSKNNPYTVSDLFIMDVPESTSATEGQEMVWVKGIIVGALNSTGKAFDETVASNIAIAAAAGEEDALKTIPIQLPTGTMRAGLNVVDNPSNKGKEVMIYGYLLKYMSRTGIKNVSAYILDGNEVSGTKQAADISWSSSSASVTIGADDNIFPTLNNPNGLTVSYSSSKEEVATIDANGNVTLVAAGSAKIYAIFAGNDSYEASTVSYNLTVKEAQGGDEDQVINVAKALEIINALEDGKTTTEEYVINAYIVTDPDWKPYTDKETGEIKNYNVTFYVNDTQSEESALYVYNIWNIENTYFPTQHESVVKGAFVSMKGKLQKYVKNDVVTPELVKAHFLSYNASSINNITADKLKNGAIYNVAGQQVTESYKGLVIKNGKKFVIK